MNPEWDLLRDDAAAQQVWRTVLRPIADELAESSEGVAARVIDRIRAEQPQVLPKAQFAEGQPAGVGASIRQLARTLADGKSPRGLELPAETMALGRARVVQGVRLAYLIRSFRLAQDSLWEWLFERITASTSSAAEQAAALQLATSWLFDYFDSALDRTEKIYEGEREAWLRSAAAARTSAIDEVLGDRERDSQRAARKLRYDVNRHHLGVAVWLDAALDDVDTPQFLAEAVAALGRAMAAESTLTQPTGPLSVSGWLSRHEPFDPGALDPAAVLRSAAPPAGLRAALGDPGWGLKGFRDSHVEAVRARRVATLSGSRAGTLTRYRDVALVALSSADPAQAVSFVRRVLGPLAADDEATFRVAMTLSVYLQENRSPARAAQRLTVHPNTVSYRVNQAETILGRGVDGDALDVSMALALLPLLPGLTAQM